MALGSPCRAVGVGSARAECGRPPMAAVAEPTSTRFVSADGRVIDHTGGGVTTSEGQSYALFFALVANDRAAVPASARAGRATTWPAAGSTRRCRRTSGDGAATAAGASSIATPPPTRICGSATTLVEAGRLWRDEALARHGARASRPRRRARGGAAARPRCHAAAGATRLRARPALAAQPELPAAAAVARAQRARACPDRGASCASNARAHDRRARAARLRRRLGRLPAARRLRRRRGDRVDRQLRRHPRLPVARRWLDRARREPRASTAPTTTGARTAACPSGSTRGGRRPTRAPGPVGFLAVLLPRVAARGDAAGAGATGAPDRSARARSVSTARRPAYYDQNLVLFAQGALEAPLPLCARRPPRARLAWRGSLGAVAEQSQPAPEAPVRVDTRLDRHNSVVRPRDEEPDFPPHKRRSGSR